MSSTRGPIDTRRAHCEPLRILLVCDWFLRYVAPYALALRGHGMEVALLCRDHAHEFDGRIEERDALLDRLRSSGVRIFEMPGRVSSVGALGGALRVVLAARRWSPDVVHAQSEIHDPRLLAAIAGYPTALTVHDPELHWGTQRRPAHLRALQWAWRRRAQLLIAHGSEIAASLGSGKRRVAVLPHGAVVREAPLPVPDTPAVLLFGRLEQYKGLTVLLEAMERVWVRRPETRLVVAGKGCDAAAVPVDPRIEALLDYVPEAEIDSVFRRASVAALPYVDASQSGVGLDALGRGIPVVVTAVGALPELALDPSYIVPPRDPCALAGAILEHLDDGWVVRAAVLDRARQRFAWDGVAGRASVLLLELATGCGSARASPATRQEPAV
jgi:alpha-maltose-1-phosphate synthase